MKLNQIALAVATVCAAPAAFALTPAQVNNTTVRLWLSGASAPTASVYKGVLTLCEGMQYRDAQGGLHTNPGTLNAHLYLEGAGATGLPGAGGGDRMAYTCRVGTDDARAGSLEGRDVVVFHTIEGGSFNYVTPHIAIAGEGPLPNTLGAGGTQVPYTIDNDNIPGQLRRTSNIEGLGTGANTCANTAFVFAAASPTLPANTAGNGQAVFVDISGQSNVVRVYRGCPTFNQVFTPNQPLRTAVTQNPDRPEGGFSDTEYLMNQLNLAVATQLTAIGGEVATNIGQVFGAGVSFPLYFRLQQNDIAAGRIAATCDDAPSTSGAPNLTAACQPSMPATLYTTVANRATIAGVNPTMFGIASPGTFPGTSQRLQFHRRAITSGTQSTSNLRFLNAPCATGEPQGALAPSRGAGAAAGVPNNSNAQVTVFENSSTGGVRTGLNNASNAISAGSGEFGMGWLSLENIPSATDRWAFVKLDGVAPNEDAQQRQTAMDGLYSAFYELVAFTSTATTNNFPEGVDLIAGVNASLGNPGITDLPGLFITPLAGATGSNVGKVYREGNSCRPAAQ